MLVAVWLLTVSISKAAGPAYYSTTGDAKEFRRCTGVGQFLVCAGEVDSPENAADTDLNGNFATLRPSILAASLFPVSLQLGLSGTVPKNHRAGVVLGSSTGLSVIGTIRIQTYLKTGNTLTPKESIDVTSLAQAVLGTTRPGRVEFIAKEPFNLVEVEAGALLGVAYRVNVYYAYGVDANIVETAKGVLSRFAAPVLGAQYSTRVVDNNVTVCLNSNVANPERAADALLTNYATLNTVLGVSCPNTLRVKLEAQAPRGYYAGFVVGKQSLADIQALGSLRVSTFLNGEPQQTVTGLGLLQVAALPNNQYQISFPASSAFDEVQLMRSSGLSLLDNLDVYFGFGIEPTAFRDQLPVLSNFASGAGQFEVRNNAAVQACVLCGTSDTTNVANGARAADANLGDYAAIRTGLVSVLASTALRLNLNGAGEAGNAAGAVLSQGNSLLNTQVINNITINTYDASGNLLESASGANLLNQGLLPNGLSEVYFNTTQAFSKVEVTVRSAAAVLARTRVYFAFAEDKPLGFPTTITALAPLPVELVSFTAQVAGPAVEAAWRTASERNNAYFVVERALQAKDGFVAVGQVAGSGTSTGRSYRFRDETAAATRATMLYYRLRQVDTDGTQEYSPVVVVSMKSAKPSALTLYPNPAARSSTVRVSFVGVEISSASVLRVYDVRGVLLRELPAMPPTSTLQGEDLPAGLYHVVLLGAQAQLLGSRRLVVMGGR